MPRTPSSQISLAEAHALGRKLLKKLPGRGAYGDKELIELAEEFGLTRHRAWAFRNFANDDRGYTRQELQELLGLCREHRYEMRTSLIELLIRVPRGQRRGFERKLVQNRWSHKEANRHVQALKGKVQGRGPRHKLPADLSGRLLRLDEACTSWQRLADDLSTARNGVALPPGVRQQLRKAKKSVSELLQAVANARRGQARA